MDYTNQQLSAYIVILIFVTGVTIGWLYGCIRLYVFCCKPRDTVALLL